MKHEELTKDIIGAAMTVLNELKPGIDEKLYENALVIELEHRGHIVEQQREFPVHYREQFIGKLVPDLIVDDRVIADPKVVAVFNDTHMAQMLGYLPELISIAAGCVSTFTRMAPRRTIRFDGPGPTKCTFDWRKYRVEPEVSVTSGA